ncbi:MAG: TetR/AcrR family transcriptional regulator [Myxococcota bacterium]|nr:TetR/AcrR family transcriptional regulator [Myxococcota bacterium]
MPTPTRIDADAKRKQRTRQALLEAAVVTFSKRGYHATLISDIVAEAGLGQGTFYRYFNSKREIIEVIFDDFVLDALTQFSEMSEKLPESFEEYRQASLRGARRMVGIIEARRDVVGIFLREAAAVDSEFEAKLDELSNELAALAQFYLDHAIAKGFARPCNSAVVAQLIIGMAQRLIVLWWKRAYPELTHEDLAKEIVDLAFDGFGIHAPMPS